jgi:hypothetical protein
MLQRKYVILFTTTIGVLIVAGITCGRSYRFLACSEIEAARAVLQRNGAPAAVAALRKYARSGDSFVRTQAVRAAGDIGPECDGEVRERCMAIVGEALDDTSGYVLHLATQDIGRFGASADRYINALLAISTSGHTTRAAFALQSLGRIGPGRSDVGDRLIKAISETNPVHGADKYPLRTDSLRVLRSWGSKACPWLPRLRVIRDSWQVELSRKPRISETGHGGPRRWADMEEDVGYEILVGVVEALEKQCNEGAPERRAEKDRHNP